MNVFSSWLAERPSLFALMSFGMNVRVLQPLTNDLAKFDKAFDRLTKETGGLSTHTYDAVNLLLLIVRSTTTAEHRRRFTTVVYG